MGYSASTFQPIREAYQGYMMRSRLEVRWARWLDECLVKWSYESQGFRQDSLAYRPDFALSRLNWWMEVKPFAPLPAEVEKARMVAAGTGRPVLIVVAEPWASFESTVVLPNGDDSKCVTPWVECPECETVSIRRDGLFEVLDRDNDPYAYHCGCDALPRYHGRRLLSATAATKAMRFGRFGGRSSAQ